MTSTIATTVIQIMKKAIVYIVLALCIAESTAVDLLCDQSDEKDDFNEDLNAYLVSYLLEVIQGQRGLMFAQGVTLLAAL